MEILRVYQQNDVWWCVPVSNYRCLTTTFHPSVNSVQLGSYLLQIVPAWALTFIQSLNFIKPEKAVTVYHWHYKLGSQIGKREARLVSNVNLLGSQITRNKDKQKINKDHKVYKFDTNLLTFDLWSLDKLLSFTGGSSECYSGPSLYTPRTRCTRHTCLQVPIRKVNARMPKC